MSHKYASVVVLLVALFALGSTGATATAQPAADDAARYVAGIPPHDPPASAYRRPQDDQPREIAGTAGVTRPDDDTKQVPLAALSASAGAALAFAGMRLHRLRHTSRST